MKFLRDDARWVVVALPPRATTMAVMMALLPPAGDREREEEGEIKTRDNERKVRVRERERDK